MTTGRGQSAFLRPFQLSMRPRSRIPPLALLISVVRSSPVPQDGVKPKAGLSLLVLLVCLGALLIVLFVAKWLYIIRRRRSHRKNHSCGPPRSGWYDNNSARSSKSRLRSFFLRSGTGKSGFFIGLLGSPSWETRHSAVIAKIHHPLVQAGSITPSCRSKYQLSSTSHRSYSPHWFSCRSPIPEKLVSSVEQVDEYLAIPSPAIPTNNSPLLSDTDYMRVLQRTPSSHGDTVIPVLPTANTQQEIPLPSSEDLEVPPPSPVRTHEQNECSGILAQLGQSPSALWFLKQSGPVEDDSLTTHTSGDDLELVYSAKEFHTVDYMKASPIYPRNTVQESDLFFESRQTAFSQIKTLETSTSLDPHSSRFQSTVPSRSRPGISGIGRNHHSPKPGPSPLRSMLLPPGCDTGLCETFSSAHHNQTAYQPTVTIRGHGTTPNIRRETPGSTKTSCRKKSADADSLLNLMSELVQETNAWDPSLFVDENFKTLITQLKPQTNRPKPQRKSWRASRPRRFQSTTLEDIPEVDGTSHSISLAQQKDFTWAS